MTGTMRAMVLTGHGGLDRYEWRTDWPKPEPGPGEVLIRVHACGLNNTDVNTRTGWYAKEVREPTRGEGYAEVASAGDWGGSGIRFPRIQGADVCGVVEAVGEGVDPALAGRRVIVDPWLCDWSDPENREKARFLGSEADGGFVIRDRLDPRRHLSGRFIQKAGSGEFGRRLPNEALRRFELRGIAVSQPHPEAAAGVGDAPSAPDQPGSDDSDGPNPLLPCSSSRIRRSGGPAAADPARGTAACQWGRRHRTVPPAATPSRVQNAGRSPMAGLPRIETEPGSARTATPLRGRASPRYMGTGLTSGRCRAGLR